MGQAETVDDGAAVKTIATTVLDLAKKHVFPGKATFLTAFPTLKTRAVSFDARFRIQTDVLDCPPGEEVRSMIVIRFSGPDQAVDDDPWSLWVRGEWPDRRDRLPDVSPFSSKTLRRAIRGRRRERDVPAWGKHENLWISEKMPTADLEAQIALFLLQTKMLRSEEAVSEMLVEYLRTTFRALRDGHTLVGVYLHLRASKWWPDDWRAWRRYIRASAIGETRSQSPRHGTEPDLTPDQHGRLTVDQLAFACHISRSKAHDLFLQGQLRLDVREGDTRRMIPLEEVERLKSAIRRRDVIELAEKYHPTRGAARKWVYRQESAGRTLEDIGKQLLGNHS